MKKILLSLVALIAAGAMNAQVKMYAEVGNSDNVAAIPVTLCLDNEVEITAVEASFTLPKGLTKANYVAADKDTYLVMSERMTDSHKKASRQLFKSASPNDLLLSIVSDKLEHINGTEGAIGTFTFDGSSLADGSYSVKMYGAFALPNSESRFDATGEHTPFEAAEYSSFECEAGFTIKDGKVEGATSITVIETNAKGSKAIYNVNGQRIDNVQRGVNIIDGKKILVK